MMENSILRLYRTPGYTTNKTKELLNKLQEKYCEVSKLETELCYHIEIQGKALSEHETNMLKWVLQDPFNPFQLTEKTAVNTTNSTVLIEVGPRFNFSTSNSTNAVSICKSLGLHNVVRLEVSRRYLITLKSNVTQACEENLASLLHDRMTECRYTSSNIPKKSFNEKLVKKENIRVIDVMQHGKDALKEIDAELGLAFDAADLEYYTNLFKNVLKRNPTSVECFDLAQSNSEHSRHWFFKGKMIIDGVEHEHSLIDLIINTQKNTNPNNVIKFSDNSRYGCVCYMYMHYNLI